MCRWWEQRPGRRWRKMLGLDDRFCLNLRPRLFFDAVLIMPRGANHGFVHYECQQTRNRSRSLSSGARSEQAVCERSTTMVRGKLTVKRRCSCGLDKRSPLVDYIVLKSLRLTSLLHALSLMTAMAHTSGADPMKSCGWLKAVSEFLCPTQPWMVVNDRWWAVLSISPDVGRASRARPGRVKLASVIRLARVE